MIHNLHQEGVGKMWLPTMDYNSSEEENCSSTTENNGQKNRQKLRQHQEASRGMVVLPYVKGLSEATSRIMKKYISTAMKPLNIIRRVLVRPKD